MIRLNEDLPGEEPSPLCKDCRHCQRYQSKDAQQALALACCSRSPLSTDLVTGHKMNALCYNERDTHLGERCGKSGRNFEQSTNT